MFLDNKAGIDTSKALLEEIRKENKRESDSQAFLLEPLLALTGSLALTQTDSVSTLHKCDIPTQLFLSSNVGLSEAILWLNGPGDEPDFNNHQIKIDNMMDGPMRSRRDLNQAHDALQGVE